LQTEQDGVLSVLREFEIDPVQLRRRVRAALGKGSYESTEKVVHRSEECRREVRRVKGEISLFTILTSHFLKQEARLRILTSMAGT
jgi:hypothetical protein